MSFYSKIDVLGALVIPISIYQGLYTTEFKCQNRILKFDSLPYDLRFAVTFHKAQGQTMGKVILDVRSRPKLLGRLVFSSFYVGLSRVKEGEHIRIIPYNDPSSVNDLRNLAPDKKISEWISKYESIPDNDIVKQFIL